MLEQLNDSQREAVQYCDGPQQVIAGAGSGKTRVLTYKIAYLIEQGMKPWNILALTFTNKAANEMKQRIVALVGEHARYLNMGTFHSIFARILRSEAQHIGYNSQFTIYDETDSRSLLKAIIKEMELDDKQYKPATVHSRISMAKNKNMLPEDYARSDYYATRDRDDRMPELANIYTTYQQRLHTANAMDFDDLLLYTFLLFRDNEEVRRKYAERFQYVLVDEYQDTNAVQQDIVLQIVRDHQRVCVVGDDAQSIYGFRGANIDNILDFQQAPQLQGTNGEKPRLYKLEQNYRSTKAIVLAANSLITKNQRQLPKTVFSENEQGERLRLLQVYSDREEATVVCKEIKRMLKADHGHYTDFAILYRTNAQSRTFEEQMRRVDIPYRIVGGLSFYQRKEIKDVIAYLRLIVNPHDEEAFRRIINYPTRGLGNTTVDKVLHRATELGISPWDVASQPVVTQLSVNKGTATKLMDFCRKISGYAEMAANTDVYEVGKHVIQDSGIAKDIYSGTDPDDVARQENIQELLSSMQEFVDTRREEDGEEHIGVSDFLQEVSLMSDLDSDNTGSDDKVTLMTIHSAKGLEFKNVFVVGMEENIFPSPLCCDSMRKLEEERRLLYVAITRAEKRCVLTCAENRYHYGRPECNPPSRFLHDIDPALIDIETSDGETPVATHHAPTSSRPVTRRNLTPVAQAIHKPVQQSSIGNLHVGSTVEHDRFGIGTIEKLEGSGESAKATVTFRHSGTKQLLLKFARIKVID